jgi:hypothetical protein
MGVHCRMDPITDGNPIGWTIRTLSQKLLKMLVRAGYKEIAGATDLATVRRILPPQHGRAVVDPWFGRFSRFVRLRQCEQLPYASYSSLRIFRLLERRNKKGSPPVGKV